MIRLIKTNHLVPVRHYFLNQKKALICNQSLLNSSANVCMMKLNAPKAADCL